MESPRKSVRAWLLASATFVISAVTLGCNLDNSEFLIRDRPRAVETDAEGNEVPYYLVHVGDTPTLSFRSKFIYCDYAIMHDTRDGGFEDCGPDLSGAFEWPYTFKSLTPPGQLTTLTVTGYATAGQRDLMPYNGRIMELDLGNEPEDGIAAKAELNVRVYQSRLVIPFDMGGAEPLWRAARLFVEGKGVRSHRIRYSEKPRRGCFTVEGPDGTGRYTAVYEPNIKEIDPAGTTEALLQVPDEDGRFHDFRASLTPPIAGQGAMPPTAPTPDGSAMPPVDAGP